MTDGGRLLRLLSMGPVLLAAAAPAARAQSARFCALGGGHSVQGRLASFALPGARARGSAEPLASAPPVEIGATGVSPRAAAEARRMLDSLLSQVPESVRTSLARARVFLVIIPESKRLTDLPEFKALQGRPTSDGRTWDDVRGAGFVSEPDGSVAVAAGEENFIPGDAAWKDPYPKGYLLVHEFSHCIHEHGLYREWAAYVERLFAERTGAGLPFPSRYAGSNAYEYYAVSSNVHFQLRYDDGREIEKDDAWVKTNDPRLYGILSWIYGSSRPIGPGAPAPLVRPAALPSAWPAAPL